MLSDNAKMIIGILLVVIVLYYVNSLYNSPIANSGMVQNKSTTTVNANKKLNMNTDIYPGQVFEDTGNYYNSASQNQKQTAVRNANDTEWDSYFDANNSVTSRAQIRDNNSSFKPIDSTGGQYATYEVPTRKKRNKTTPPKLTDGSLDPDMYDPDNLLPQEEDSDWFEVIDKPVNLKGRLLRLENPLGINTIAESLKIPNLDLRPSPPCPKFDVSPWNNSSVEPDTNIKSLY